MGRFSVLFTFGGLYLPRQTSSELWTSSGYDGLLETLYPKATRKRKPDMDAADRVIRIVNSRAKLLGLNAPDRQEVRQLLHDTVAMTRLA